MVEMPHVSSLGIVRIEVGAIPKVGGGIIALCLVRKIIIGHRSMRKVSVNQGNIVNAPKTFSSSTVRISEKRDLLYYDYPGNEDTNPCREMDTVVENFRGVPSGQITNENKVSISSF